LAPSQQNSTVSQTEDEKTFSDYKENALQYCLIRVQKVSVGPNSDDELRSCIDDGSKLSFGFGYLVESLR
jgi:hypothetical protein